MERFNNDDRNYWVTMGLFSIFIGLLIIVAFWYCAGKMRTDAWIIEHRDQDTEPVQKQNEDYLEREEAKSSIEKRESWERVPKF